MKSAANKYKWLKFLAIFALVIAACAIAQNSGEEPNKVPTDINTPDVNSPVNADPNQQDVTTPDANNAANEDANQQDVPTPDANDAANKDANQQDVTTPDANDAANKDANQQAVLTPDADSGSPDSPAGIEPEGKNVAAGENVQPQSPTLTLDERLQRTISVDFVNTPIEDVIRMIAEQADVDIIKSPTVTGYVTATLTNVPLSEALKSILNLHGYGCIIDKNMISVVPLSEIAQQEERTETRIYHITYADIADVEGALRKIISKRGSISSSKGTSDIIVKDVESNMKAIDSFVEKIDRITPQVLVEVRIYDITDTEGFDIGADWSAGRNNPVTTIETDETINELTHVTTTETTTKTTDTTWQGNTAGASPTSAPTFTRRKSKPFVGGDFAELTGGTLRLGFLDTLNAEIALNILRTQVGAKLLANPRILVLDNETAQFKIVTEIPYTEVSETSSGGSMTSTKFKDVGVELKVIPHVTRDGMVRLNITPVFSVRVGSTTPPTVDSRSMNTKALVKDGTTVVLGGLRKREVTQEVSKVAFLGDIPLLGAMFSDVEEEVVTNELLIFITPKIVTEPMLAENEAKGLAATEFGGPKVMYLDDEKDK
jgi:type IV pilus assembly protein PilQ